jgi:hypothetical protein
VHPASKLRLPRIMDCRYLNPEYDTALAEVRAPPRPSPLSQTCQTYFFPYLILYTDKKMPVLPASPGLIPDHALA